MTKREEGAATPNHRQGQEQPQHQDAAGQRHIHLNWSNFKPEFSGKPEEDAEAHLLWSNDWMEAHCFNKDIRVQRFCLTLLGEARLWYHSLEPLGDTTCAQLQNLFRQRYSKLGNTCKQLFHAWRSFTFDENTETIDSYVIGIRQVATLLGYGEPQILEVFKNTLPTKLYWVLFPMEGLRQAVETAKRIAMAYFYILRSDCDTEVILVYDTEAVLLYFFVYYLILWYVTYTFIVTYY